jgi:predicted Zn-dependent peptidase
MITASQPGPFTISLQVEADKADEALALTSSICQNLFSAGPTLDEIKRTKQFLVSVTPLQFESNRSILSIVSTIAFYNLPKTWSVNYPKNVEKVTLPEVKEALIRRLSQQPVITVIVGQQHNGAN